MLKRTIFNRKKEKNDIKKLFGFLLICSFTFFSLSSVGQTEGDATKRWKSPYKKGYIRLGLNMGTKPDQAISPLENVKKGNWGTGNGYSVDFGHIFYFLNRKDSRLINAGLDWTILSLAYTQLNKWDDYAPLENGHSDLGSASISVRSKLGPMIAFNPADKLVIEARVQLTYGVHLNSLVYRNSPSDIDQLYFLRVENEGLIDYRGLGSSIGATVRYGFFGFSVDWLNAKISSPYYLEERNDPEVEGIEKMKYKDLQVKISFSF